MPSLPDGDKEHAARDDDVSGGMNSAMETGTLGADFGYLERS